MPPGEVRARLVMLESQRLVAGPARDDRRQKLFERVKARFVPVAEYRGGLLAYLAPPNMTTI